MLVAITGHANGIGAAITDSLIEKGYTVIGFDLETGDDIRDADSIVEQAKIADVFINNAYAPGAQVPLLQKIFAEWAEDETKTIVNIGSKAKYFPTGQSQLTPDMVEYTLDKRMMDEVVKAFQFYMYKKCRLISINPGFVVSELTKSRNIDKIMLTPEAIADAVMWAIEMPQDVEIGELSIWTRER
jgi:NADP-dependent 3-hydroxy acid dehydrogenase YdfG